MLNHLLSLLLAFVAGGFCWMTMAGVRHKAEKLPKRQDTDIDTILANAEKPFYAQVT